MLHLQAAIPDAIVNCRACREEDLNGSPNIELRCHFQQHLEICVWHLQEDRRKHINLF